MAKLIKIEKVEGTAYRFYVRGMYVGGDESKSACGCEGSAGELQDDEAEATCRFALHMSANDPKRALVCSYLASMLRKRKAVGDQLHPPSRRVYRCCRGD